MSEATLSLLFTQGERAVAHAIDPETPVREIPQRLALYLGSDGGGRSLGVVWLSDTGPVALDPGRPVGEQVPAEAVIELRPV